jgi:phosphoribosylglycinamide formyltransferase 1
MIPIFFFLIQDIFIFAVLVHLILSFIMKRIAIFASGSGTNAENIVKYFKNSKLILVSTVLTNRPDAYVIERAKRQNIECLVFTRSDFYESDRVLELLLHRNIDFIVLAGFLWLIPQNLLSEYPDRIINIHPALLPKYGGKGMYGMNVHQAVISNKEWESGITVHFVNEKYDDGQIIFQASCKLDAGDSAQSLANKIHILEYEHYPKIIERVVLESM